MTAPGEDAIETLVSYDTLGRVAKVRHRKGESGNYRFTTFAYDQADWLTTQLDYLASGCQKINNVFTATGWEDTGVVRKAPEACDASPTFTAKQSTDWDYFANGKLKKLTTRKGDLSSEIVEQHDIEYTDPDNHYVNGHRTKDIFFKKGSNSDCNSSSCRSRVAFVRAGATVR